MSRTARWPLMLLPIALGLVACRAPAETAAPTADEGDRVEAAVSPTQEGVSTDDAEPPLARSIAVPPGEFAEVNFRLEAGATAKASYATDGAATKWNVHSHGADHQAVIHAEGVDAEGTLEFTAPTKGMFSFLWVNEGDGALTIEVTVAPSQGVLVHSWVPEAAPPEAEPASDAGAAE